MKILGIETSCDETAAALVEDGRKIVSNVVASSSQIHAQTGGIVPENAARKQVEYITPVIKEAIFETIDKKQKKSSHHKNGFFLSLLNSNIDAIAVTYGPGLIGSLLVGVEAAKTISYITCKPLIPVNHLVAHIYANWLFDGQKSIEEPQFPALCLVVSGGHTDLVIMKKHNNIKWVGGTRDDAAGEAFDKTARLLGLPYPGGPAIAKTADNYLKNQRGKLDLFPRPMIDRKNFDWSFSGLKTAVFNYTKENGIKDTKRLAAEIQEAIVEVLVEKSIRAIKKYQPVSFLMSGGVAANKRLREKMHSRISKEKLQTKLFIPSPKYCTDNAAVIASAAYFNNAPIPWQKITAKPNLEITDAYTK